MGGHHLRTPTSVPLAFLGPRSNWWDPCATLNSYLLQGHVAFTALTQQHA